MNQTRSIDHIGPRSWWDYWRDFDEGVEVYHDIRAICECNLCGLGSAVFYWHKDLDFGDSDTRRISAGEF